MTSFYGLTLPIGWAHRPLKHLVSVLRRGTAPQYADDGPIRALSQAANQWNGWDWNKTRFHAFSGPATTLKGHVVPDDIVLNSTGTGTLGRVGYYLSGPDSRPCIADGHLTIARARKDEVQPRFLYYYLRSSLLSDVMMTSCVSGATNQIELNSERLGSVSVPIPSMDEQQRIADFLDNEIRRLDRLIGLRAQQISLLEGRRWSHFEELVSHHSKQRIPLRRVIESIIDGPFGSAFSSSDYVDDGAAVVRLGNIGFSTYRHKDQAYIPEDLYEEFRSFQVQEGDVLIAGLGDARNHAGRACLAPNLGKAIVKGKCFRARIDHDKALPEYVALILSSYIGKSMIEGRGSTRSMINLDIVKAIEVPMPSVQQQSRIVRDTTKHWEWLDSISSAVNRQLSLLAERRQALITAAVTGQFDVSTASGRW